MKTRKNTKNLIISLILIFCFCFSVGCKPNDDDDGTLPPSYEYVYLGSYPMSKVTDANTLNDLTMETGALPTNQNFNGWTDYEYYANGTKDSFAFYKDVTLDEKDYRAVYFTKYRPSSSKADFSLNNSFVDDNGYSINTLYFFKFEPIKWRVLKDENGEKTLLCEYILDCHAFQNEVGEETNGYYYTDFNDAPYGTYACNYEYSYLRHFLNNEFYNTAFSEEEKEKILLSTVKNDYESANKEPSNLYSSADTNDCVFAPSIKEITNKHYGFSPEAKIDSLRTQVRTDYALICGAHDQNNGMTTWWLRSFYLSVGKFSQVVYSVAKDGKILTFDYVYSTSIGIVPMLKTSSN